MPYYRNIPGATQRISASQPQLQNNTNVVDDSFNQDHVHHAVAHEGKHNDVHFMMFAVEPPANTEANDLEIFNFTYPVTGIPELYFRRGVAAHGIPFTARGGAFNYAAATPSLSWTYLPSGIIIKCGKVSATSASLPINLNGATIPAYTVPPLVFLTISDPNPHGYHPYTRTVTAATVNISIQGATAATNVDWLTMGI